MSRGCLTNPIYQASCLQFTALCQGSFSALLSTARETFSGGLSRRPQTQEERDSIQVRSRDLPSLFSENSRVRETALEKTRCPRGPLLSGVQILVLGIGGGKSDLGERLGFDLGHITLSLCKLGLISYEKMNTLIVGKP